MIKPEKQIRFRKISKFWSDLAHRRKHQLTEDRVLRGRSSNKVNGPTGLSRAALKGESGWSCVKLGGKRILKSTV